MTEPIGTQSVEAANFLHSWCWHDFKPRSRMGVRVITSVDQLRNGSGWVLHLEHLMKDNHSAEYRKGNGLIVLRDLIAKADEVHVPITLVCRDELIPYYEQVGFIAYCESGDHHYCMFRNAQ